MISLEWYRSFIEVYRVGTVSGAARVLYLTQPAVSQQLAALESALGTLLFQRTARRMVPTEAGKRLYTQIAGAIETLEAVQSKGAIARTPRLIRMGTPQEFFKDYVLSRLPTADCWLYSIRFGLAQDLIDQLSAGELEVAIATQKIARSDIDYQPIFEEQFWLIAPPMVTVPIAPDLLQSDLTLLEHWLSQQDWIAYSEDLPIIRRFWRIIFGRRIAITPKLIVPDLHSIRQAVEQGFGFSVLPDYLCQRAVENQQLTVILRPKLAIGNRIWLACKKSDRQAAYIAELCTVFQQTDEVPVLVNDAMSKISHGFPQAD